MFLMMQSEKIDLCEKFWNDWLKADSEKRINMVQKTLIARELSDYLLLRLANAKDRSKIKKSFIKWTVARQVNDYFEDFESVLLSKKR
ncbi:MAG: hypothetical protein NTV63_03315 [Candidatus Woesearchaeota archaeon]|nr:hypothetical protein [Candidatus Woesearchaeota archaeon]